MSSLRERSKGDYSSKEGNSFNALQIGCLQRIADATEAMAKNHNQLIADRDWHKNLASKRYEDILSLRRQVSSLKGVITKLKKGNKPKNEN